MLSVMASQRDIRKTVTDFVSQGKVLCEQMRSPDKLLLSAVDLHVLRLQLQTLDAEAANLELLLSRRPQEGQRSEHDG